MELVIGIVIGSVASLLGVILGAVVRGMDKENDGN